MKLSDLSAARTRFFSDEYKLPRQLVTHIKDLLQDVDISKMDSIIAKGLGTPVIFFETLDRIFRAGESDFDLIKEASPSDDGKVFVNQLEKDLYDASKAIFEARFYLAAAQSGGAASSDPNQFHAEPSKARDVDASFRPMFELVDKVHSFAEEEILPHLSTDLRDELNSLDSLTTMFKIDSNKPGEAMKYIISDVEIQTKGL